MKQLYLSCVTSITQFTEIFQKVAQLLTLFILFLITFYFRFRVLNVMISIQVFSFQSNQLCFCRNDYFYPAIRQSTLETDVNECGCFCHECKQWMLNRHQSLLEGIDQCLGYSPELAVLIRGLRKYEEAQAKCWKLQSF